MAQADYDRLDRSSANHIPLSPLSFLRRSAVVYGDRDAVIDSDMTLTYAEFDRRCRRLASALAERGIKRGDTVAILCRNTHEMLEARYAVPMLGAVLNPLNTRQDPPSVATMLAHGKATTLICDHVFAEIVLHMRNILDREMPEVIVVDSHGTPAGSLVGERFEDLIAAGDPAFEPPGVANEWDALTLLYTSGTTGAPKGVVYHHRGAYLAAMANAMAFHMGPDSVFLWTLPMFHCDGWGYVWATTAAGATHVCLESVDAALIHERMETHGVTHLCGAPVVLNSLLTDFENRGLSLSTRADFALGGAAPPAAVIDRARRLGFDITHLYGLTETYGPSTLCVWQPAWEQLDAKARAARMARQGVANFAIEDVAVLDEAGKPVADDGETIGELCLRGHTVMKGYLNNPEETDAAFADGWFHTGDLAVRHADGYVEIKDRAKDIIISGGENISSLEIESVLYEHPAVAEVAVVAEPHPHWGERPCAFVTLVEGAESRVDEAALIGFCRERMAHFKVPGRVVFGGLPRTATGKVRKSALRDSVCSGDMDS
ncbi:AMP-binding protein [Salinisphaera sp. RV14]|uniref:AMP-binding protein n=1 Tax=unclassified Salinisphaera TaxID=2649847 RepID=UPI003F858E40